MSKKQDVIEYLFQNRRGDTVTARWLRHELWDHQICVSRATTLAALSQMRKDGWAEKWGNGRSTRWYVRKQAKSVL